MRFSIITCSYNSAAFINELIKSVELQTFSDYEHIFIDSYSTDGTVERIQSYREKFPARVKLFQTSPRGISAAMNEGLKKASGEYILHLHADDSLYDSTVLADVDTFIKEYNPDWIYGKINVISESGAAYGDWPRKRIWQTDSKSFWGKILLKFYNFIPHQAVFVSKAVFEKFGYFDETLSSAMDPDLWLRISPGTTWSFYDRIISNFLLHSGSQTGSLAEMGENKKNIRVVRKRYLRNSELLLAGFVDFLIRPRRRKL